jgi:hypothetical protein
VLKLLKIKKNVLNFETLTSYTPKSILYFPFYSIKKYFAFKSRNNFLSTLSKLLNLKISKSTELKQILRSLCIRDRLAMIEGLRWLCAQNNVKIPVKGNKKSLYRQVTNKRQNERETRIKANTVVQTR